MPPNKPKQEIEHKNSINDLQAAPIKCRDPFMYYSIPGVTQHTKCSDEGYDTPITNADTSNLSLSGLKVNTRNCISCPPRIPVFKI